MIPRELVDSCRICRADKSTASTILDQIDDAKLLMLKSLVPNYVELDHDVSRDIMSRVTISNYICYSCSANLRAAFNFQKKVKTSEEQLWEVINKLQHEYSVQTYDDVTLEVNHRDGEYEGDETSRSPVPFEPEVLLKPFFLDDLERDLNSATMPTNSQALPSGNHNHMPYDDDRPYITKGGTTIDPNDLEAKRQLPLCDIVINFVRGENGKPIFLCPYCPKQFTRRDNGQRHIKEQHIIKQNYTSTVMPVRRAPLSVPITPKRLSFEESGDGDEINDNIRMIVDGDRTTFYCALCNTTFTQRGNARRHIKEIHRKEPNLLNSDDHSPLTGLANLIKTENIDPSEDLDIPVACILEERDLEARMSSNEAPLHLEQLLDNAVSVDPKIIGASLLFGLSSLETEETKVDPRPTRTNQDPVTLAKNKYIRSLKQRRLEKEVCKELKDKHLETIMTDGEERVVCKICRTSFTKDSNAMRHLKVQHLTKYEMRKTPPIIIRGNPGIKVAKKKGLHACENCSRKFVKKSKLRHHMRQCVTRSSLNSSVKALEGHLKVVHRYGRVQYACNLCATEFTKKCNGIRHLRHIHFNPDHPAADITSNTMDGGQQPEIKPTSQLSQDVKNEVIEIDDPDDLHNDDEEEENTEMSKSIHEKVIILVKNGEETFVCTQCEAEFTKKCDVVRHIVHQHETSKSQLYRCQLCVYRTNNSESLTEHLQNVHPNVLPG